MPNLFVKGSEATRVTGLRGERDTFKRMSASPAWLEGFTAFDDEPAPLVPILLLDAFILQRLGATAIRCAVIGCVGGELRLIPESHLHRLPKLLLEAWQRVESRALRSVRAEDFVLCAMDAFNITATGWHIWLRAMVHVRVANQEVHLEPLHAHGQVAVPSAVAEVAVRWSATDAFDNPRAAGEVTHHWWLPTLESSQTRLGCGLLLMYTLPDPAMFEGADNQAVQRRLETDLGAFTGRADPVSAALEAFLNGDVRSSQPMSAAPLTKPLEQAPVESSVSPAPKVAPVVKPTKPLVSPAPIQPLLIQTPPRPAGTLEPFSAYQPPSQSQGADWSSDFAVYSASQRATQSAWWRDFAPNAVGVDGLYKARGSSAGFEGDFE